MAASVKEIDFVQICVKFKTKSMNIYIETLNIPFLCSSIERRSIETLGIWKYNYLKNIDFADKYASGSSKKSVDISL